jgi:hypothetical protein
MNYFEYFPVISYTFAEGNTSWSLNITDITRHVTIIEAVKAKISVFYPYVVQDGERPDTVATKVYGGPEYTWIVLVTNNILNLYDWPLTEEEMGRYIIDKYGSQANAVATKNNFYLTTLGDYVDFVTYYALPPAEQGEIRTAYEDEIQKNETKRRIRVIPAAFVGSLQSELERVFI